MRTPARKPLPLIPKYIILCKDDKIPSTWGKEEISIHNSNIKKWKCSVVENLEIPRPIKMCNIGVNISFDITELSEEQAADYDKVKQNHIENMSLFNSNLYYFRDVKIEASFKDKEVRKLLFEMRKYK